MPPTTTRIARAIMVVLAVTAVRVGWRVRLPCASMPVPWRARSSANSGPKAAAMGRISTGASSARPIRKTKAPAETSEVLPDSSASAERTISPAPAMPPSPRVRRFSTLATAGRSASTGWTRPAESAGSRPASRVMPTPETTARMTMPGVTTGPPGRRWM